MDKIQGGELCGNHPDLGFQYTLYMPGLKSKISMPILLFKLESNFWVDKIEAKWSCE